jgi:hypothetical protein
MTTTDMNTDIARVGVSAPKRILQSVLAALNEGKILKAVDQFDDHFTFTDHALDLEFTDKGRLANAEITSLLNGSLRQQHRRCRMDPHALQFQFTCEAHRSCVLRTEESLIGPTTMIETDLGGSVWLHFSQSGSSTNRVLANRVLRRGPHESTKQTQV